jgi:hypothetical protein
MNTTTTTTTPRISIAAQCGSCTYWQPKAEAPDGECRRHAPQTIAFTVDESVKFESRFPTTKAVDWCGDYAAKA